MGGEAYLDQTVYLADRASAAEADELIRRFGDFAASEAARRASKSRSLGNVVHYCRWRQIERMIGMLAAGRGEASLH